MTRKLNTPEKVFLIFIIFIVPLSLLWSQDKILSYPQAFEGAKPHIFNALPDIEGWLDDDNYLTWQSNDEFKKAFLIKTRVSTGTTETFIDFTDLNKEYSKGTYIVPWDDRTRDYAKFIFNFQDDLFLFIPQNKQIIQLTKTSGKEKNPKFSPDGGKIAFTRDHNLFVLDLRSKVETQVTHDGNEVIYNGWASWVYYEEILGRRSRYAAFWWAPNSENIAFMRFDDTNVPEYPIFHCEGPDSYLEMQRYPEAGEKNPFVKFGIYHLITKNTVWIDTTSGTDDYIAWPFWAPHSESLYFQWMNRGQNIIQIRRANISSGISTIIYQEKQSAWVEFFEDLYIMTDNKGLLIRSDRSGWRHILHYDINGNFVKEISSGNWDVEKIVKVDEKEECIYFLGSLKESINTYLYKVSLNGGKPEKLTPEDGVHEIKLSQNCRNFIDNFSNINQPGKCFLRRVNGELIKMLGQKWQSASADYKLGNAELFSIETSDGMNLPAKWILPPNFDQTKKYPFIFKVYGGPGRASVMNKFPSLSDFFYAQNDIIVINVDHRGSKHFGKKGTSMMHRALGKWEIEDLIQAVKWLKTKPFTDPDKIGIVGGSYGGYVACLALTYGAEFFTHGIARYSVTDWRFYDSVYTERYMDKPDENPEGYTSGSALNYVDKYEGHLLITHGALDDNVHMQNTIEFVQELQKLNKDFEMQIYPNQRHGIRGKWRRHAVRNEVSFWFKNLIGQELDIQN
jgi:dipeptidyl-peptidase-4